MTPLIDRPVDIVIVKAHDHAFLYSDDTDGGARDLTLFKLDSLVHSALTALLSAILGKQGAGIPIGPIVFMRPQNASQDEAMPISASD
jgi:hypothetical protein